MQDGDVQDSPTSSPVGPASGPDRGEPEYDRGISRIGLVLAILVGVAMIAFWTWAFIRGIGVPHQDELVSIELREEYVDYAAEPIQFRSNPPLSAAAPEDQSAIRFMVEGELICADMVKRLDTLPNALSVETFDERAELLDEGTDILLDTIVQLEALDRPTETNDASITADWLTDYRIYEEDRRAFANQLRSGDDGPFVIRASSTADRRVTTLLTSFAEVNSMYSCVPPGDVG